MLRALSAIGVYKEARKYGDFYNLCDSKTDQQLTWYISQLSWSEYYQLKEAVDRKFLSPDSVELRDMCEDLADDLKVSFRSTREWLIAYARKSLDYSYLPKADDFNIPQTHWDKFEETAKKYTPIYLDLMVSVEKVNRIRKLFNEYRANLKPEEYFFHTMS